MATSESDIRMVRTSRLPALAAMVIAVVGTAAARGVAQDGVGGATSVASSVASSAAPSVASPGASFDASSVSSEVTAGDAARDAVAGAAPARRLFYTAPAPEGRSLLAGGASTEGKGVLFGEVLQTAAALGATLLAIVLARSVARRFGGAAAGARGPSGVVGVLARYPLARGQQVVLLEVGRRILVTHQTAQSVTTLSEFSDPDDVADLRARCEAGRRGTHAFSFDALLRRSSQEFDAAERSGPALTPADRAVARAPDAPMRRGDVRSVLPAAFRSAEIETVDLTRQGARR